MAERDIRKRAVAERRAAAARAARRRANPRRRTVGWVGAVGALIVVVSVVLFAVVHRGGSARATGTGVLGPEGVPMETGTPLAPAASAGGGAPVDGVSCDASEQVAYHIHSHLAVFVDGALRPVPAGIGIVDPSVMQTPYGPFVQATRCYYWLHTHVSDGVVHIESPTEQRYTLGDFFDIWGQPLTPDRVGPATGTIIAYVNGSRYTGDPRGIILTEREDIQLVVGTPAAPPRSVDWTPSQL